MDFAKLLFFILIIGFAIFKELGSSAKKEKAARKQERRPVPPMPSASAYALASTAMSPANVPVPPIPTVPPKPYRNPVPPVPPAKPENASPAPVFEEGMRVTADITPMSPTTPSVNRESTVPDLSNPANLRAAIIFSEILAPKF